MTNRPIHLISLALVTSLIGLPAGADPLLEMMRGLTKEGPIYAYEMTLSGKDFSATGLIDPSKPEGERIHILTPDKSEWPEDFSANIADMEADTDGDIWCAGFAENIPDRVTKTSETDANATYVFTPLPDSDADGVERKLMKKMDGEVTIDKQDGAILAFKMRLPKPYKPAIVAKVNVFDMQASCQRAPDGRAYIKDFSMSVAGSAMMQDFEEQISREITSLLEPVG
ncbi:MAG: hypothetical protein Hens3KO_24320 [Henriciella sp.]